MKNHYLMLSLVFLVSSCTINLQIDTDYAAQRDGSGNIEEEVTTETTSETSPDVEASIPNEL